MSRLEGRMNFVGYSILCNQWMLDWGIAWNEYECRKVVDDLVQDGVVERHDVFNLNNPQFPTAAVRLARTNETVQNTLGLNRPRIGNPVRLTARCTGIHPPQVAVCLAEGRPDGLRITCGGAASDTVSDDVRITANGLPCFHCRVSPEQPGCSLSVDTIEPLG